MKACSQVRSTYDSYRIVTAYWIVAVLLAGVGLAGCSALSEAAPAAPATSTSLPPEPPAASTPEGTQPALAGVWRVDAAYLGQIMDFELLQGAEIETSPHQSEIRKGEIIPVKWEALPGGKLKLEPWWIPGTQGNTFVESITADAAYPDGNTIMLKFPANGKQQIVVLRNRESITEVDERGCDALCHW